MLAYIPAPWILWLFKTTTTTTTTTTTFFTACLSKLSSLQAACGSTPRPRRRT